MARRRKPLAPLARDLLVSLAAAGLALLVAIFSQGAGIQFVYFAF